MDPQTFPLWLFQGLIIKPLCLPAFCSPQLFQHHIPPCQIDAVLRPVGVFGVLLLAGVLPPALALLMNFPNTNFYKFNPYEAPRCCSASNLKYLTCGLAAVFQTLG